LQAAQAFAVEPAAGRVPSVEPVDDDVVVDPDVLVDQNVAEADRPADRAREGGGADAVLAE
jgi:hypothetical protein